MEKALEIVNNLKAFDQGEDYTVFIATSVYRMPKGIKDAAVFIGNSHEIQTEGLGKEVELFNLPLSVRNTIGKLIRNIEQ